MIGDLGHCAEPMGCESTLIHELDGAVDDQSRMSLFAFRVVLRNQFLVRSRKALTSARFWRTSDMAQEGGCILHRTTLLSVALWLNIPQCVELRALCIVPRARRACSPA